MQLLGKDFKRLRPMGAGKNMSPAVRPAFAISASKPHHGLMLPASDAFA